ncbi:hypothetical protein ACFPMF_01745 [Larkinella bovis]|uniref:Peptidase n=1 Tax=Larkinella bovis TaxID=683041 RepID=A0ABW0I3Y6_9BACT
MPKPKTFRVSDQTITCFNVRILSSGLKIDAFLANPVMLYMHVRGRVIGKWNNLRLENNEWLAESEFDTEIELGAEIGGQVDRGFLNAASIVAEVHEVVWNEDLKCYDATSSTLQEISIVDVGGNRNALKLCDSRGEVLTEDQAKGYLLQLSNQSKPFTKPQEQMDYKAIALACGLAETATQEQIVAEVIKLKAPVTPADGTNYKEKYEALVKKQKDEQDTKAIKLVDAAIAEKRISADQKDTYIKLFATDFSLAETVLNSMKAPVDLVALAAAGGQPPLTLTDEEAAKKYDELDRNGKLVKLMADNRPEFDRIYNAKWGKTYSGK